MGRATPAFALIAIFVALLFGCGVTTHTGRESEPVGEDAIATPLTERTAILTRDGAREREPFWVENHVLIDDARLVSVEPETCIDVVSRTEAGLDVTVAEQEPRCLVDSEPVEPRVEKTADPMRVVHVYRKWYVGLLVSRDLSRDPTTPRLSAGMQTSGGYQYHVMTHYARICCPAAASSSVVLQLENALMGEELPSGEGPFRERFYWDLR
jgi:hypothetical protein